MKSNILIVDDSALLRRVECDIINSDNKLQATDTCKDGLEALEKLRTQKYDAVILDINMPRMNGLEVLSHLQKESIKTPVVVVSTLTIEGADEAMIRWFCVSKAWRNFKSLISGISFSPSRRLTIF